MLSALFGISTALASRISITWVLFMEKELDFLLNFATLKEMEGLKRPKVYRDIKYEKLRAHVEHMIRKLKCYRMLKSVIPLSLKGYITSIVRVCAALVNLQPSLIRFEVD